MILQAEREEIALYGKKMLTENQLFTVSCG